MAVISDILGIKDIDSPAKANSLYRGRQWGPLSWGRDEFSSWFGINLKKGVWNRLRDEALIQDGFYGFYHHHS
jgi:hypothetical protein